jgi:hypothetical protein
MYHRESNQEDFLVLAGEAIAIVEGEERPLKAWDFLHCPPGTNHIIVGAGDGPCLVFMTGARLVEKEVVYPRSEVALRHGAGVEADTNDRNVAYAPFPKWQPGRPRPPFFSNRKRGPGYWRPSSRHPPPAAQAAVLRNPCDSTRAASPGGLPLGRGRVSVR